MVNEVNTDEQRDREERQRINQRMYDYFNGVVRCSDEDCDCGGDWNMWEVAR
jgi:hypothetical protein